MVRNRLRIWDDGWLDWWLLMYCGSSFGFLYGWYIPSLRSNVTSRKLTGFLWACTVIFNPNCSKILFNSFLVLSANLAEQLHRNVSPSSRYKPTFFLPNFLVSSFRMDKPINLHTSAPSKLPIVTYDRVRIDRLTKWRATIHQQPFQPPTIYPQTTTSNDQRTIASFINFIRSHSFWICGTAI